MHVNNNKLDPHHKNSDHRDRHHPDVRQPDNDHYLAVQTVHLRQRLPCYVPEVRVEFVQEQVRPRRCHYGERAHRRDLFAK